jgi:membrane associated rhomboid family serine protease
MLPHPELDFRRTPVTLLVAAVAVAIELVCTFDPARREVYAEGWKLGMLSLVWSGELWRPFTTTLLHGGIIHVAFNVYGLLIFGRVLEPFFGSLRYLLVLALLACASTMPNFLVDNWSTPLDGQIGIVGLSGVLYGLFGILWVGRDYRPAFQEVCTPEIIQMLIAGFFFCIALTYLQIMPIGNVAHGAGCAVGLLYGHALFDPKKRLLWRAAALLVTLLAIGSMYAAPGHPLYKQHLRAEAHNRAIRVWIRELDQADQPGEEAPEETPADEETAPSP